MGRRGRKGVEGGEGGWVREGREGEESIWLMSSGMDISSNFIGEFRSEEGNSKLNSTRKTISHESRNPWSDECDIASFSKLKYQKILLETALGRFQIYKSRQEIRVTESSKFGRLRASFESFNRLTVYFETCIEAQY